MYVLLYKSNCLPILQKIISKILTNLALKQHFYKNCPCGHNKLASWRWISQTVISPHPFWPFSSIDTVNHKTLLSSFMHCEICTTAWQWFTSSMEFHICSMQTLNWCPTRLSAESASVLPLYLLCWSGHILTWVFIQQLCWWNLIYSSVSLRHRSQNIWQAHCSPHPSYSGPLAQLDWTFHLSGNKEDMHENSCLSWKPGDEMKCFKLFLCLIRLLDDLYINVYQYKPVIPNLQSQWQ